MDLTTEQLGQLIRGMRAAYVRGENAMAYARDALAELGGANCLLATLVAYDLQAGTYVASAQENPGSNRLWCAQIAQLIDQVLSPGASLLEVGVGEATTLVGVLAALDGHVGGVFGFDISWSRIAVARRWLQTQGRKAELFVGDLMHMPLANNSIDVVYSSHSLEPNGGREEAAIAECLRIARDAVVLIEPLYELAPTAAQARMFNHGYVRGLRETAERLGAEVMDYRLLEYTVNPLNPSGVLLLRKSTAATRASELNGANDGVRIWQCPITGAAMEPQGDLYYAPEVGIAYPVLRGIPLLRPEHAVVASGISG